MKRNETYICIQIGLLHECGAKSIEWTDKTTHKPNVSWYQMKYWRFVYVCQTAITGTLRLKPMAIVNKEQSETKK